MRYPLLFLVTLMTGLSAGQFNRVGMESGTDGRAAKLKEMTPNMNGKYKIANPNPHTANEFNANYAEYHQGKVEYFDAYSPPITSRYGEVFWTMMDEVPLDPELVRRFDNKIMAVVGYEANQVFKTDNGDVSVPTTWAYNHHYLAYLKGKLSEMRRTTARESRTSDHGARIKQHTFKRRNVVDPRPDSGIPTSQFFSEGNGGEYRKSFHGYPRGYAQLIESPVAFQIQPMQIDTKNRDYNGTDFRPGPIPKISPAPPDATYSGLLECPCATRIPKNISVSFATLFEGTCDKPITSAKECGKAAIDLGLEATSVTTIQSNSQPSGCFSVTKANEQGTDVYFNALDQSVEECSSAQRTYAKLISSKSKLTISVVLDSSADKAEIELVGPADKWFAVGFNAVDFVMSDQPYTVVVDGTGQVEERRLGVHEAGTRLKSSVTVTKNGVINGQRTVTITRRLKGLTELHYSFDVLFPTLSVITASGQGAQLAYHGDTNSGGFLNFVADDRPTCICKDKVKGTINGIPFHKTCLPEPKSELLAQKNPTCFVDTYVGGQACCHHKVVLLDTDQEQPEGELTYHLKFRFWYQEYTPIGKVHTTPSHDNLLRLYWQTEAWSSEYDILPCPPGTPPHKCTQVLRSNFTVRDMMPEPACDVRDNPVCWGTDTANYDGVQLIYVAGHCHAPTCLFMELYNADTDQLICRHVPLYGRSHEIFDELGYITIPPCLFGRPEDGLNEPPFLSYNTNLYSLKVNNNTIGHFGEMASWQMRGVLAFSNNV